MIDVDELPIPDWGLSCPNCGTPLAGMRSHHCSHCRQPFSVLVLLSSQKPIPDIGLTCHECGYLLTGLMRERCPECGTAFSVRDMLEGKSASRTINLADMPDPSDHHIAKRKPTYNGRERPLPDFGLVCEQCESPLIGAPADSCPACGAGFDLLAIIPRRDWVNITDFIPASVGAAAKAFLYDAQIPYVVDNAGLDRLYGGNMPFLPNRLRVPREFFLDALGCFAAADTLEQTGVDEAWICPQCNEHVPEGFGICWNCGGEYPQ